MKIKIPRLSTSNAISFCQSLPLSETADIYYFDVSEVNNYEPLPMLLTAVAIRQFCNDRALEPNQIQLRYEDNTNYQYACHMGFFQAAGFGEGKAPGEAFGSSSYIPLTKIDINELQRQAVETGHIYKQGDIIEIESKRLAEILSQGNRELKNLLQYLLREAIRNIPEHAKTNDVWICGQYWQNRDLAEIAILDEGIGIYNSILNNPIYRNYITSNDEALRWALKPGVSVSFNPVRGQKSSDMWANSGYGLFMISEICKLTEGWFTFVSGCDCLRVFPNTITLYGTHYKGTALGIRIKPSKISSGQLLINQARAKGEETAKTLKNTFKKASIPSKGLLR